MRSNLRTIDRGAREVVTVLNRIPGITTRGSCEGVGSPQSRHRHADLAYVVFRHPMPLRLQAFLVDHLDAVARIEDDGIYSRWPTENRAFLDRLAAAAHAYVQQQSTRRYARVRCPLPKLRSCCARALSYRQDTLVALCFDCAEVVIEPHAPSHQLLPLVRLTANENAGWFAEFVGQPENALDSALIAADGWEQLAARSQRGDFGPTFHRRWLRYRTTRLADLSTWQIRRGVHDARSRGFDLDFFYDDTHAVFTWPRGDRLHGRARSAEVQ